MHKKTRSILEELSSVRFDKEPENFVEHRASHIIDSAINLVNYIRENFDPQTSYQLEKKFNSAIKNLDRNKFYKGVSRIKELKEVKKSFTLKEGEFKEED
tara:strand:- start:284 stop:583 length:300 start_codon:yes stop_codon:yes gene_type:complete